MISLDTETCAWINRPGWKAPPLVCVSLSDGQSTWVIHRSDPGLFDVIRKALAQGIVGHHVAFDMSVLAANGFPLEEIFQAYEDDRITCTMAREKLIDIASGEMFRRRNGPGYSLAACVKSRLGKDLDKSSVRLEYEQLYNVPVAQWPEAFKLYAATDALVTFELWQYQEQHREILEDEYRQARGAFWLQLAQCWGTLIDLPRLAGLAEKYGREFEAAGKDLIANGLARLEKKGLVRNMKKAGERIIQAYAIQGLDYPRTEKGGPCLDQAACEGAKDAPLARYSEYMILSTKVNKEIPALSKPLIHPGFDSLVETGRTSCREPNLQNLPQEGGFRQCLIPRRGNVFISADFSGFELATWAQCCIKIVGYSKLAEALNEGLDAHCLIAAELLGWTYEHAFAAKKDEHPDHTALNTHRQIGKAVNFGAPGGAGIARLCHQALNSYGVNVSEDMMRHVKYDVWATRWTESREYFDRIQWAVDQYGYIEQLFSNRRRGGVKFTDACNGPFQGLAADIAKDAGFRLSKECYLGRFKGNRIVNFVHDEYVIEVPEGLAKEQAPEIRKLLVDASRPWLPDVKLDVEVKISRRYKGDYVR